MGRRDGERLGDDGVVGLQVDQAQGQDCSGRRDVQVCNVALDDELQGLRAMLSERVSLAVLLTNHRPTLGAYPGMTTQATAPFGLLSSRSSERKVISVGFHAGLASQQTRRRPKNAAVDSSRRAAEAHRQA